jgi:hypothetical protein
VRKMLQAAAALAVCCSGTAFAATAMGPICNTDAKVISTTYYSCTGSTHTALDIGGVPCGEPVYAPIVGTYSYRLYGGCANTCSSGNTTCNGGAGNYYVVTGANGWDFRMLHFNTDANSTASKTCDRCKLGQVGMTGDATVPHVHLDNRQYGTRSTSWYTKAGTTCGSSGYCGNVIGYPTL